MRAGKAVLGARVSNGRGGLQFIADGWVGGGALGNDRRKMMHPTPMTGLSAGALKSSQLLLTSSLVTAAENTGLCIRR